MGKKKVQDVLGDQEILGHKSEKLLDECRRLLEDHKQSDYHKHYHDSCVICRSLRRNIIKSVPR